MNASQPPVPVLWWFWIPVVALAVQVVLEIFLPQPMIAAFMSEQGVYENVQFVVIFAAFILAARNFFMLDLKRRKYMAAWIGIAALCCFYVAGEEISWGQQLFSWATPESWSHVNDQNETNLHNTSAWLDQKPRIMLEIGVLIGGIIIPLLRRLRPSALPRKFAEIYPENSLCIAALVALGIKLAHFIEERINISFFERASEIQELYLFYFVLLYMIQMHLRFLQDKR